MTQKKVPRAPRWDRQDILENLEFPEKNRNFLKNRARRIIFFSFELLWHAEEQCLIIFSLFHNFLQVNLKNLQFPGMQRYVFQINTAGPCSFIPGLEFTQCFFLRDCKNCEPLESLEKVLEFSWNCCGPYISKDSATVSFAACPGIRWVSSVM